MAVCKMCCVLTAMLRPTRKHGAEAQDKLGQQIKTQSASGEHLSSRVCLIRARDNEFNIRHSLLRNLRLLSYDSFTEK